MMSTMRDLTDREVWRRYRKCLEVCIIESPGASPVYEAVWPNGVRCLLDDGTSGPLIMAQINKCGGKTITDLIALLEEEFDDPFVAWSAPDDEG